MIKNVRSINNTLHIALFNYENSFCHHIAVLQRLHSSPTLNNLLNKYENINDISKDQYIIDIIYPVHLYAKYKGDNDDEELQLYTNMKQYYSYFVQKYVSSVGMNGYLPLNVLVYIFMPVIYNIFPNDFQTIISELHMDKIDFNTIEYVVKDIIINESNAFFKNEFTQKQYDLYNVMIKELPNKFVKKQFVSAVLEVYPNKDKTGGHAITLIKSIDNSFYIIDDQNSISKLEDYYTLRKSRLYYISVRDIDEITIANINAILHANCTLSDECAFSKRVSRYELNFEHNFITVGESDLLKKEFKYDTQECGCYINECGCDRKSDHEYNHKLNNYKYTNDKHANEFNHEFNHDFNNERHEGFIRFIFIFIIGFIIGVVSSYIYHNRINKRTNNPIQV